MSKVVIVGGSVAGLAAALAVAGQGRQVLVLERGGPPPDGPAAEAAQLWARPTVPSYPHAHTLTTLGVATLLDRAPEVVAAALDAGAAMIDLIRAKPPNPPGVEPGDADLLALACRRPTLELVLYRIVRDLPGVEIRHGVVVRELMLNSRRNRVTGVVTGLGEQIRTRIVLDATGRRALARSWLADHGIGLAPDRTTPTVMRIFSRFYRRLGQTAVLNRGNAAGVLGDHYASVLHPGDGGTFSIALGVLPEDRCMRSLRDVAAFTAVAAATPGIADWLAPGMSAPITGVQAISCPPNILRTLATTPEAPVAGLIPVGDAACVTNPMYGRGVSLALAHAFRLADLLGRESGPALNRAAAALAADLFTPWYRQSGIDDTERIGLWRAAAAGSPPPPLPRHLTMRMVAMAARDDAVVWRGLIRMLMGLNRPAEILGDPEFEHRVRDLLSAEALAEPTVPTRADLLEAVARGTEPGR